MGVCLFMALWKDFSKKVNDVAVVAVDEGNRLTEMAKKKYILSSLKQKKENVYKKIGEIYYKNEKGIDSAEFETLPSLCDDCQSIIAEIEKNEAELEAIKVKTTCPKCGKRVAATMEYCPFCGAKIQ